MKRVLKAIYALKDFIKGRRIIESELIFAINNLESFQKDYESGKIEGCASDNKVNGNVLTVRGCGKKTLSKVAKVSRKVA